VIVVYAPEISFGFIPNGGYAVGLNCVYIVAVSDIPLDKSYTISELAELYYSGKVILTYGGLSEFHRGHMMTEEVYNSYRCAQWCEGGCGGREEIGITLIHIASTISFQHIKI